MGVADKYRKNGQRSVADKYRQAPVVTGEPVEVKEHNDLTPRRAGDAIFSYLDQATLGAFPYAAAGVAHLTGDNRPVAQIANEYKGTISDIGDKQPIAATAARMAGGAYLAPAGVAANVGAGAAQGALTSGPGMEATAKGALTGGAIAGAIPAAAAGIRAGARAITPTRKIVQEGVEAAMAARPAAPSAPGRPLPPKYQGVTPSEVQQMREAGALSVGDGEGPSLMPSMPNAERALAQEGLMYQGGGRIRQLSQSGGATAPGKAAPAAPYYVSKPGVDPYGPTAMGKPPAPRSPFSPGSLDEEASYAAAPVDPYASTVAGPSAGPPSIVPHAVEPSKTWNPSNVDWDKVDSRGRVLGSVANIAGKGGALASGHLWAPFLPTGAGAKEAGVNAYRAVAHTANMAQQGLDRAAGVSGVMTRPIGQAVAREVAPGSKDPTHARAETLAGQTEDPKVRAAAMNVAEAYKTDPQRAAFLHRMLLSKDQGYRMAFQQIANEEQ